MYFEIPIKIHVQQTLYFYILYLECELMYFQFYTLTSCGDANSFVRFMKKKNYSFYDIKLYFHHFMVHSMKIMISQHLFDIYIPNFYMT